MNFPSGTIKYTLILTLTADQFTCYTRVTEQTTVKYYCIFVTVVQIFKSLNLLGRNNMF